MSIGDKIIERRDRLAECEAIVRQDVAGFIRVGNALRVIRDEGLYADKGYETFGEYCEGEWPFKHDYARKQIRGAEVAETISNQNNTTVSVLLEKTVRPLTRLKDPTDQIAAWKSAERIAADDGGRITEKIVNDAVRELQSAKRSHLIPLEPPAPDTFALKASLPVRRVEPPDKATRGLWIPAADELEYFRKTSTATFNKQTTDSIEWARWSWNPVTGCLHGCTYCYARAIATSEQFAQAYPQKFEPTFIPERLGAPRNTKLPAEAETEIGWKNVFVCSMADLWGKWVPKKIIQAVLREVNEYPQWNYLFLTKFPDRYLEFDFPANTWLGTSVDNQKAVERAETSFAKLVKAGHRGIRWLSVEPMLEPIKFGKLSMFNWVVIGGQSANEQCGTFSPPVRWVHDLITQADRARCKVYLKSNWYADKSRLREYPNAQL